MSVQDDLPANKDTLPDSIPCGGESSIDGEEESELTGESNAAKEIFFKEINFSPDLTIRIDYQVIAREVRIIPMEHIDKIFSAEPNLQLLSIYSFIINLLINSLIRANEWTRLTMAPYWV